jgi:pimeloyl-ACP methyl ester carboxylesterase
VITDAFIDRWAELQRAPGHRAILMSIQPGKHSQATKALLSTIKVPTLVLWGETDPLIEVAGAHKFADAIPGAPTDRLSEGRSPAAGRDSATLRRRRRRVPGRRRPAFASNSWRGAGAPLRA